MALLHMTGVLSWERPSTEMDLIVAYRIYWTTDKSAPNYRSRYWDYVPPNPAATFVEVDFPLPSMTAINKDVRIGIAAIDDDNNIGNIVELDIPDDLLTGLDLVVPEPPTRLTYQRV